MVFCSVAKWAVCTAHNVTYLIGEKTMMTVRLGTGLVSADDFCRALKQGGCKFNKLSLSMLQSPAFTVGCRRELDLVYPSVARLGFVDGASGRYI